ncbi:tRNA (guanosine(37)-N1)-methyltransferase TrmD [Isoptericola variabilis]|uniref:tRNA (guanine-N(1)-)-methyltransferase n=1 Tax=Isoptericola variabilis (strain 225) TaxID=743718 RepID=F6FRV7_ISOV2|nr:tRNA (guanosine(37)-N1)-methyltransferase TrmD [Isoptericola variabilis]AEG43958.1 tRNA (guanine-N(1)-)-methyltransferase [Isoptericola variabilis 225]TWH30553.1 tRNA (guanine37-N1)-methyltransferase [Isoptericola variabilis J7]
MRVDVVSIFPEYLAALDLSLVGKARRAGLLDLRVHDLRDWTTDRHRTVDDTPFGGGAGMVMRPDVWGRALDDVLGATGGHLVVPTPSGEVFTQRHAEALATEEHLVVACGRYEGIDARVVEHYRAAGHRVSELSIGDYVLNGGEVAALVMIEAVGRLLPGVVGNPASLVEESHGAAGLLEYPVYTKPPAWEGLEVPGVLLSGHHARIERWRRDQALARTAARRPDMLERLDVATLDRHDLEVLAGLGWEVDGGSLRRVRDVPGDVTGEPADEGTAGAVAE